MVEYDVQPLNVDSRNTANAELVRATYDVTGKNVCVLVEEPSETGTGGAMIRNTHQEFSNGQTSRVTWHSTYSNSIFSNHATHVAGTIGASGESPNAKGFAIDCSFISCTAGLIENSANYLSDSNTLNFQLSNHSWGAIIGYDTTTHNSTNLQYIANWPTFKQIHNQKQTDPEFRLFGKYLISHAKKVDESCYDASTVLSVWSSGNSNNDDFAAIGTVRVDGVDYTNPIATSKTISSSTLFSTTVAGGVRQFTHTDGNTYKLPTGNYGPTDHDSLGIYQCAKNTLVVGSVADITSEDAAQREGAVSSFSSRGPTDDGRIKPEIVANGISLYGPIATSNDAYDDKSGTSMACPSVTGCAALNLEYYRRIVGSEPNGRVPSATLKALMLLTAFRNDKPPTYTKGYGVVDVSASLGFLSKWNNSNVNNANYVYLQEHTCHGKANTSEIYPNPALDTSVNIMVCWNDHYELRTNDVNDHRLYVDSSHSVITNQLLVSCSNETYYPWYLNVNNPSAAARNAVHAGTLDSTYGIKAPHDNTKLIEFMPTGSGRHTLTVSLSPSLLVDGIKPNNATGQKYTIAIQNARSQSTIIYFKQNPLGAFSAPYYRFYSDANHSNELSSPCVLETGKSYDFRYHGGNSGHPFWIGSSASRMSVLTSGATITSAPSGRSHNSGIQSGENFTLSIESGYDGGLHYYCTNPYHNGMLASFTVASLSLAAPDLGSGAPSSSAVGDPYVYPLFVHASNRPQGHMRRREPSSDAPVKLPDVAASYCMLNSRRLGLAVNASVGRASADHQQRMVRYARELQASGHADPSIPISDIVTDGFFFQELVIRLDADLNAATPRPSRLLRVDLANKELRASDSEAFRYEWVDDEDGTTGGRSMYRTEQFEEPCRRLRISWTPNVAISKSDADDDADELPPLDHLDVLFFENPHLENGIEAPMPIPMLTGSEGVSTFRTIENGDTRGLLVYEYDTPLRMQVDSLTATEYTRGDVEGERLPPHRVKHETWHWHRHGHCDGECVAA